MGIARESRPRSVAKGDWGSKDPLGSYGNLLKTDKNENMNMEPIKVCREEGSFVVLPLD